MENLENKKEKTQNALGMTAFLMTLLLVFQKALGLFREGLLANYYGTSGLMDAFLMSESISIIVMGLLFHFTSPFTPIYAGMVEEGKRREAKIYQDTLFSYILLLGVLISIVSCVFARPIVHLLASGFSGDVFDNTVTFFCWSVWNRVFFALGTLLIAYLHYHGYFIIPRVCYLLISALEIITIVLSVSIDQRFLRFTLTLGNGAFFLSLLFAAWKRGYKPQLCLHFSEHVRRTILMVLPGLFSIALSYVNTVIDKNFASSLPTGTVSSFNYASVLFESIYVVFSTAVITIATPRISKLVARNDTETLCQTVKSALNNTLIIMIPLTCGGMLLRNEIVSLLYQRGAFDLMSTLRTGSIFAVYALDFCGRVLRVLLSHVIYSHKRTVILTLIGLVSVVLNILLNILLMPLLAHVGLALATVISGWAIVPLYAIAARKHLKGFPVRVCVIPCLKCLASALLMSGAIYGLKFLAPIPQVCGMLQKLGTTVLYIVGGVVVYAMTACILRVEEVTKLLRSVLRYARKLGLSGRR